MIQLIRAAYYSNFKNAEYCALSTDLTTLPTYLKNGDKIYVIDTGKKYIYNSASGEIVEEISGGGGGGSGVTVVEIDLAVEDNRTLTITNATALCNMFDAVFNDPSKAFIYGLIIAIKGGQGGTLTCIPMTTASPFGLVLYFYSATPDGLNPEFWVGDGTYTYDEIFEFSRDDIAADDTITVVVVG